MGVSLLGKYKVRRQITVPYKHAQVFFILFFWFLSSNIYIRAPISP